MCLTAPKMSNLGSVQLKPGTTNIRILSQISVRNVSFKSATKGEPRVEKWWLLVAKWTQAASGSLSQTRRIKPSIDDRDAIVRVAFKQTPQRFWDGESIYVDIEQFIGPPTWRFTGAWVFAVYIYCSPDRLRHSHRPRLTSSTDPTLAVLFPPQINQPGCMETNERQARHTTLPRLQVFDRETVWQLTLWPDCDALVFPTVSARNRYGLPQHVTSVSTLP